MVEEQCQQQPHQRLIEDFIELSEGLSESSDMCVVVFLISAQKVLFLTLLLIGFERFLCTNCYN